VPSALGRRGAPGLAVGTWIAGKLGEAVAGLFDLPVRISTTSYLITTVGVLAPPLRRVGRRDLDSSTKTLT